MHRKTCRRYNDYGHAHFLTFSCLRRQPFFRSDRACRWFLKALCAARSIHEFDVWAYVLMPEHVHLLIWPRKPSYSISDILTDLKQPVTRTAVRFVREHSPGFLPRMQAEIREGKPVNRFWQRGGGYDRNIWTDPEVIEKINYIHENPVRRGLAVSPVDYRWSSARAYAGWDDVDLALDVDSLPEIIIREGLACPR